MAKPAPGSAQRPDAPADVPADAPADAPTDGQSCTLHATTVAVGPRALVITGPSGSGKSGLGLELMALGAELVADDRTIVTRTGEGPPVARAPEALSGLIEARGLGLLSAEARRAAPVAAIVDLGAVEAERLPPARTAELLGWPLPLFHKVESPHFAPALMQYLRAERIAP